MVGVEGPPIAVTTLLLRAGDLVVLFTWRDLSPDPDWAGKLLGSIAAETVMLIPAFPARRFRFLPRAAADPSGPAARYAD